VFGIASLVTPFVLGMCAAAIASGRIRIAGDTVHATLVGSWTGPLSWVAGFLSLAMCAFLAATYLTVEAVQRGDAHLENRFRRRALGAGVVAGVLAGIGLLVVRADSPTLWHGMLQDGWPFVVLSAVAGVVALAATARGRERIARSSAAVAVASVVVGWGVSQWPYLIVPDLTAAEAAAPKSSLGPIAIGLAAGAALVLPSLLLLFRVFKASRTPAAAVRSPDTG
jgi:cytochrome d ubiquinol oxidase subunit II